MSDAITYSTSDRVASIGLNRLDKKNALTSDMYAGLVESLRRAEGDAGVRVILIHGSSECFTAGNDLHDFLRASPTDENRPVVHFLKTVSTLRKPLVAAAAGPAIGIGTTMLLHCDLAYADPGTRFQMPFVNLGLCPEASSSYLLAQCVGRQRASELLLFGDPFDAAKALAFGLINEISPAGQVVETALARAKSLAARPARSLMLTKQLLKRAGAKVVEETIDNELRQFGELLQAPEAKEAISAFFDRRKPDFSKFA